MNEVTDSTVSKSAKQCDFVSDVLHKLSQPLTALQCSLELSLIRDQTPEEFRASVEAALENADHLRQVLLLLRELSGADDHGDVSVPVELHRLLRGVQEDFLPVFESAGGRFDLACYPVRVRGNTAKLTRAFFYLLEYVSRGSASAVVSMCVEQQDGRRVEVRTTFSGIASTAVLGDDLSGSGEVEIARRSFRALGGDLALVESATGQSVWCAILPLAE